MTIEEIKEIRATVRATEQEYFNAHAVEIVDTLLAEVEAYQTTVKHQEACLDDMHDKLAIATEALEIVATQAIEPAYCHEIAMRWHNIVRTALEKIK